MGRREGGDSQVASLNTEKTVKVLQASVTAAGEKENKNDDVTAVTGDRGATTTWMFSVRP
jgi:hypothetical protein